MPLANVLVDGEPMGTTPFKEELPVGQHRVRLTARGYAPWVETVDVVEGRTAPVRAKLLRKRPGRPAPAPEPEPASAPASEPAKKPSVLDPAGAPETKKRSGDVFLPTPKSKSEKKSVFLPGKD